MVFWGAHSIAHIAQSASPVIRRCNESSCKIVIDLMWSLIIDGELYQMAGRSNLLKDAIKEKQKKKNKSKNHLFWGVLHAINRRLIHSYLINTHYGDNQWAAQWTNYANQSIALTLLIKLWAWNHFLIAFIMHIEFGHAIASDMIHFGGFFFFQKPLTTYSQSFFRPLFRYLFFFFQTKYLSSSCSFLLLLLLLKK